MKYTRSLFLMLLMTWLSSGVYAQTNRLYIPDITISLGGEATLSVYMDNSDEVTAVDFMLEMPSGITIVPSTTELAERAKTHQITARKMNNGKYRFVLISDANTPIKDFAGMLFSVKLNASDDLVEGKSYPITFSNAVMSLKSGENILEKAEGGNIKTKNLPNLHVVSIDNSEPIAGSEMTVKWKVRNDGIGSTEDIQWKDYIWLVPDMSGGTTFSGSKLLASVDNITALQPVESYENTINVKLEERILGNYDLVVTSDMYNLSSIDFSPAGGAVPYPYEPETATYGFLHGNSDQEGSLIEEQNRYWKDNFFYKQINIKVPPLPDLQIPTITAEVLPNQDPCLAAGARGAIKSECGYVYDENNELIYSWEECYIPSPISYAKLRGSKAFYSGKKILVTVNVANKGEEDTKNDFNTVLYMSTSPDLDAAPLIPVDSKTFKGSIKPGESATLSFAFYLPYEWFGETYFYAYADVNDAVYELANTQNNWGVSNKYDVQLCPGADFVPSNLIVPSGFSIASDFNISYKVSNEGVGIPYSSLWKDKIYISKKDTGIDDSAILLKEVSRSGHFESEALQPVPGMVIIKPEEYHYRGDSYSNTVSITPPSMSSGTYYIYVKIDAEDKVFEYDGETDNVICSEPVQVTVPDLTVETVTTSEESLITDNKVAVSWKLKNIGSADIQNAMVTDEIFVSKTANGQYPISLGTVTNTVSIVAGGEKVLRTNITIPRDNSLNGTLYFFVKTNTKNTLNESDTDNNVSKAITRKFVYVEDPATVKVNGTNLTVTALQVASTAIPGQEVSLSYTIKNTGTLAIDKNVKQEVFISDWGSFDSSAKALTVSGTIPDVSGLQADKTVTASVKFTIPNDMKGGQKYIYVYINRDITLTEKKTDDNCVKSPIYINGNLPDYAISDLVVPATIMTSQKTDISWILSNIGDWETDVATCEVYLSPDANYSQYDKQLVTVRSEKLPIQGTQKMKATIMLDDKEAGNFYLIVKTSGNNEESSIDNNMAVAAFVSKQSPLPDLVISDLKVDEVLRPGTKVTLTANVKNVGNDVTHKDRWNDAFFLSSDFSLNTEKAMNVGSKMHVGNLEIDGSYNISATINIPTGIHGSYFIYVKTDGLDALTEKGKDNNVTRIRVYVENDSDKPSDLVVKQIAAPTKVTAGAPFTFAYTLINNGQFPATGNLREVIYLSKDLQWDENDPMVGVVTSTIDLPAGNEEVREVTGRITNIVEGNYYLIVRTNSTHTIAESNYNNNMMVSKTETAINYANISLGSTATVKTSGYYKLPVNNTLIGKTVGLNLSHGSDVPAGLYVAYEKVPSTARYDHSSSVIDVTEQEVLIPDVKEGNYYILAQDNSATDLNLHEFVLNSNGAITGTSMELAAKEVLFGASSLSIREGGTDGWLTTEIHGALLDSIMDFRLVREGMAIPVEAVSFHDQTYSHVTFNLHDADTGSYDVMSELPDGSQATLPDGFRVIPGQSVNLGVKLDLPISATSGSYVPFSIAYANGGNTDVAIKELLVVTDNNVIATSIEGLKENKRELHIVPNFGQDNRGYVNIPPGSHEVINCFLKMSGTSNVVVYIVK